MKSFKHLIVAAFGVMISTVAFANIDKPMEGTVHGYVVDATTRKPISGVTISATSSKLQKSKEVSTDADGYFRFNAVAAPDEITFEFEKKGYKIVKKEKFIVKENTTFKFTVEMSATKEKDDAREADVYEHPLLRMADGR